MPRLLPDNPKPRVTARDHAPRAADLAKLDALLIVVAEDLPVGAWQALPRGAWLLGQHQRRKCRAGGVMSLRLPNAAQTLVIVGFRARNASSFQSLQLAGRMLKEAVQARSERLGAFTAGLSGGTAADALEALTAAMLAAAFELPSFKSRSEAPILPRSLVVFGAAAARLSTTLATSEGNNLARWLTALPGNKLTATSYRQRVASLARREGWQMRFLNEAALARRGAGAFLAVAQGNARADAGIIHLRYRPRRARHPQLALIGKGICFDTGGTNLKSHKGMLDMHIDMEGSAVALGTLLALSRLKVGFAIDCWLAVTENRIGPRAYKPQDVVVASNGISIQVIHTDAEGRMVLADTLTLAAAERPLLMLDFATLTGACVNALTERYSGVFTNRPDWRSDLERAGSASGERVWCFPMDEDYDSDLDSPVADIMQCAVEGKGDHILAARFLSRFVPSRIAWAHVDLAAGQRNGGLGHISTDITGFGVRYAVNLLLEQKILERARHAQA